MTAMPPVKAYARTVAAADEARLVREHLELVKRIAWHLAARLPASVDVDDLVQAGVIGLIEAARHYCGDRGASFETYAGIRIRGAMVDELRRGDWAPRSVHRRMRDVSSAIRAIEQDSGREARDAEIAEKIGASLSEYHEIVRDATQCQVLSMHAAGRDDDEDRDFEVADPGATPYDEIERAAFMTALTAAIGELPEREKLVMSLYYDDELNLREIGEVLDVTESRVCQLHGQALLRLRARLAEWRDARDGKAPTPRNETRARKPRATAATALSTAA
ncbi:MAG: RNA polymerase sigma factor FliA [Nevskia sp.]|jgi:RNA polymerase sigma factor for flagellar operon FliA|uniref:RNA polymerase sigma factor FliA n=1 Tax=Nevskia sp. TaxID=1929292 RepID=UPI0040357A93